MAMALTIVNIQPCSGHGTKFPLKGSGRCRLNQPGEWNKAGDLSVLATRTQTKKTAGYMKTVHEVRDLDDWYSFGSSGTATFDEEVAKGSSEVIIVGAGVAGAALAYALAKDGRRVHVLERDLSEPDRFVGELLQPGGYLKLQELDLADCVNTINAQKVVGCALYRDGKYLQCPYPLEDFHSDVAGRGFHNGRFVQRMREKAASLPNVRLEQGMVTSLVKENETVIGVNYRTKNGQNMTAYAPLTVVCDGCFSSLRKSIYNPKVNVQSYGHGVGLILENCSLPFPNYGHIVLGDHSCIAFFPISSNEVRCFIDVPEPRLPSLASGEMVHYLKTVVAPQIPLEIYPSFIAAVEKGNIKSMPNRSMPPAVPPSSPGALLIGDALNTRHPLTAGGMTVALNDIVVLRNLLRTLNSLTADESSRHLESFYTLRNNPLSLSINMIAGAICKVNYSSAGSMRKELFNAFFDYLSLGGSSAVLPMSYLSCLNSQLVSLWSGFIIGATYAVGRLLLPFPAPQRIWVIARMSVLASEIISMAIGDKGVQMLVFSEQIRHIKPILQLLKKNPIAWLSGVHSLR